MTPYTAVVEWQRGDAPFLDNGYSRRHRIHFDGGAEYFGSSSPHSVPAPMSDPTAIDPEEGFVASLSSCHMLWFLALAARHQYRVDQYTDHPVGYMDKRSDGRTAVVRVELHPRASFSGERRPTRQDIEQLHQQAHDRCYLANSVTSTVVCEPVFDAAG